MNFLTYHSMRNRRWENHEHWPAKSIKYWAESTYKNVPLKIYTIGENMESMTLIPEDKWKDYEDA